MTDIPSKLSAPFDPDQISWRVGATNGDKTKGMALAYIDARDVMERLDAVMGSGWQCEYVPMPNGTYCCRLGLKMGDEWVWRSNGSINISDTEKADAKEMAEKGGYSDAFKRAAVLWGIGRYLYAIDSPWVALEPAGRSFKIKESEYARLRSILARGNAPQSAPAPRTAPKADEPLPWTSARQPGAGSYTEAEAIAFVDLMISMTEKSVGYGAATELWNSNAPELDRLKHTFPERYAALLRQFKGARDKLPREAA